MRLVSGSPEREPATTTCFVLPFAYKPRALAPLPSTRSSLRFAPDERARTKPERDYFTAETSHVLFQRAIWLVLKDGAGTIVPDRLLPYRPGGSSDDQAPFTLHFRAPRLVLFEWEASVQPASSNDALLQIGFLLMDFWIESPAGHGLDLHHLLELNENFRYWRRPFDGHERGAHVKRILGPARGAFFPEGADDRTAGAGAGAVTYTERWLSLLRLPVVPDRGGAAFGIVSAAAGSPRDVGGRDSAPSGDAPLDNDNSEWAIYPDNRSFVWTTAITAEPIVARIGCALHEPPVDSRLTEPWRRLLNVDPPGRGNTRFEADWARAHTYLRWAEYGTLYGFTAHSGAMLGPPMGADRNDPPEDWPATKPWRHFNSIYLDQALLLLYLRAASFVFSRRLTEITQTCLNTDDWQREFRELRTQFTRLTNMYKYPLISNQQQGIELYDIARRELDVNELFREVQDEIRSSHDYSLSLQGKEQNDLSVRLNVVAFVGLILTTTTGLLGMSFWIGDLAAGKQTIGGALAWLSEPPSRWLAGAPRQALVVVAMLVVSGVLLSGAVLWSRRIGAMLGRWSQRERR